MIETTVTDPEKHETVAADSQGRISLGVEYADSDVEIVIVDAEPYGDEQTGLQQSIDAGPLSDRERKGILFVRSFGLAREFLADDHAAQVDADGVPDPATVAPTDVDWSTGYLGDPENAARFEFNETDRDSGFPFEETLTEQPAGSRAGEIAGEPVVVFANESGDESAILATYADHVERMFGYDPTVEPANVRVDPDDGPAPVMFRDPESDLYVAVAPWIEE